jgi:soluble lytic murein transglycosylase-like protein
MKTMLLTTLLQLLITTHDPSHLAIQAYLESYGAPADRAEQVSRHIVHQSRRWEMDPAFVVAIVTVENHTLVSDTASTAGAVGVMQVMPFWRRSFARICGDDLTDDGVNICYGIHVLKTFLQERGSEERALLAYNGCKTLERCGHYPRKVLRRRDAVRETLVEF